MKSRAFDGIESFTADSDKQAYRSIRCVLKNIIVQFYTRYHSLKYFISVFYSENDGAPFR